MTQLTLYTRPDCHLCDLAQGLLVQLNLHALTELVDIEPDLKLIRRYGQHIPVLRDRHGKELHWPFTTEDIKNQLDIA